MFSGYNETSDIRELETKKQLVMKAAFVSVFLAAVVDIHMKKDSSKGIIRSVNDSAW
ncbi:hypothetical protein [Peribacillus saganii]|uniref:hypothetical protein n=1 Tax=Peribacillus saganii TaxID=2303992 RepID=UPI001314248B|nr:hypothetical protein [Peribacillus saganii]